MIITSVGDVLSRRKAQRDSPMLILVASLLVACPPELCW